MKDLKLYTRSSVTESPGEAKKKKNGGKGVPGSQPRLPRQALVLAVLPAQRALRQQPNG